MARQEKVCNALLDGVLVPAVAAHQLALRDLRLQQQVMQVLQHLLIGLQLLLRRRPQRRPVQPRQHVDQHLRVDLDVVLHQLRVLGVQRVRGRRRLAGLGGAGDEVEAEDLHGGFCEYTQVLCAFFISEAWLQSCTRRWHEPR
ncbi:hypothetical protein TPAR_05834 [Tolypocladium paradoxum]|uniref:Uncharacterized protein n=1 Tax=Tolypocladium paradoxum TaxID=94208 RepID=A0A2S4KUV5_9HYPO|nr:hypothetical protein TPAR_05834 [Tolypocladium paradoxum]